MKFLFEQKWVTRTQVVKLFGQNVVLRPASILRRLLAINALRKGDMIGTFSHLVGTDLKNMDASEFLEAMPLIWALNVPYKPPMHEKTT